MKLSSLSKTGRWLLAITLILAIAFISVGPTVASPGAEWPVFVGVALFLLATGCVVKLLTGSQTNDLGVERRAGGNKISNSLLALSSAAVLAVYAAGYERTNTAANRFAAQTASARRRPVPAASLVVTPDAAPRTLPTATATDVSAATSSSPQPVATVATNTITAPPSPTTTDRLPTAAPTPNEPLSAASTTPAVPVSEAPPVANDPRTVEPVAAPAPASPQPAAPQVAQFQYADGAYWGWGSCRHGDLQVQVVIEAGKISSASITKCQTRYPCSMIKEVPPEVVSRQDPDKIDNISGATQSVDAYYDAVIDALNKAVK